MGSYVKGPEDNPIVIASAVRTPMGAFQGCLASQSAPQLGGVVVKEAVARSGFAPAAIDEVLMGCVLPAGLGQAPARQAAIAGGLPHSVPASTINKMCGSGMKAVMLGFEALMARPDDVIVAGGMESMSNAPYLLPKARTGLRLGHGEIKDHMFLDGLEDAYETGRLMGSFAEDTAEAFQFSREAQDEFALSSLARAKAALETGLFEAETQNVVCKTRQGEVVIAADETPGKADPARVPTMRPAFKKDGTVTAANSSSISDGAAALVLCRAKQAANEGLAPRARIVATATHAQEPALFTTAPIGAMQALEEATGWGRDEVDFYEINEAFAVVTMAAIHQLGLDRERVNIRGGACALGHPIGASGARILTTLLYALEAMGLSRGVASLCIGGGEATAVAIERLN